MTKAHKKLLNQTKILNVKLYLKKYLYNYIIKYIIQIKIEYNEYNMYKTSSMIWKCSFLSFFLFIFHLPLITLLFHSSLLIWQCVFNFPFPGISQAVLEDCIIALWVG